MKNCNHVFRAAVIVTAIAISVFLNGAVAWSSDVDKRSATSHSDTNSDSYVSDLQKRLYRAWSTPPDYPLKKVVVIFKIAKDGQIGHLRIGTSCGRAILDNAALKAVENSTPFATLPAQYGDGTDIHATFDLSEETGEKAVTIKRFPQLGAQ
ncbi:MAG: TonB family protein [Candidatus Obscuribacterales bacterium]|nr:TonB family protein [Candidatus Obscuribacterales bacterium]